MNGKSLGRQYRDYLSEFKQWSQLDHADKWVLYPQNLGKHLSIDETSLSHGELYTIVTNKSAKGRKGSIVAIVSGTKAEDVIEVLRKLPKNKRNKVEEVTLDLAASMGIMVKRSFPRAVLVSDRFHVQRLAGDAVQEMRIKYRWEALDSENEAVELALKKEEQYLPELLPNGDPLKQLLARSRYVLYKTPNDWTPSQKQRAKLLFERYPDLQKAYQLSEDLRYIFNDTREKIYALTRLAKWHENVRQAGFKVFNTVARTIENHYETILNYFDNRSTNAAAESFNRVVGPHKNQSIQNTVSWGKKYQVFPLSPLSNICLKISYSPTFTLDPFSALILVLILPIVQILYRFAK